MVCKSSAGREICQSFSLISRYSDVAKMITSWIVLGFISKIRTKVEKGLGALSTFLVHVREIWKVLVHLAGGKRHECCDP